MSHFYGTLQGSRGEATRCGTKRTGLTTYAAGWRGAIRTTVWHNDTDGTDRFEVALVPWSCSGGSSKVIAEGVLDANAVGGVTLLPGAWGDGGTALEQRERELKVDVCRNCARRATIYPDGRCGYCQGTGAREKANTDAV